MKCPACGGEINQEPIEVKIDLEKKKGNHCQQCGLLYELTNIKDRHNRLVFIKNKKVFLKNKCPVFTCNGIISTEISVPVKINDKEKPGYPCSNVDCGHLFDIYSDPIMDDKHRIAILKEGNVIFQPSFR